MKLLICFLCLIGSALALPSAVVLSSAEIDSRSALWLHANPTGWKMNMTSRPDCGSGNSMRPMLQPNDRMFFEPFIGQKLKGCVVLVKVSYCKLLVSHLAYDENKTHIFMTGINNRYSDGWVNKSQVIGVLVGILRPE